MTPHRYNLHLRVLHQQGVTQQVTFSFSDDTELGEEQFAEFVPDAGRDSLAEMRCTVCWRAVGTSGGGWWLACDSQRWLCSVNDVPLAFQHSVPLHSGDRIELGMLHLEVVDVDRLSYAQHGEVPAINPDAESASTYPMAVPVTNSGADDIAASLTSLIRGEHAPLASVQSADPFDIVPAASTSAFSPDASDDEVSQDSDGDIVIRSTGSNILDALRKDYILAIQDPASLHVQRSMQALPESTDIPLSTPTGLALPAAQHASIEDMVSGTLKIDDVLPLISSEVWQLPFSVPEKDVLHLFAKGIAMPAQRAKLPSLTRREHHAFSPDSSYSAASASESKNDRPSEQHSSKKSRNSVGI